MGKSNSKFIAIYDPPYGLNIVSTNKTKGSIGPDGIVPVNAYFPVVGDESTETSRKVYELLKALKLDRFIIFGGNYMTDFCPLQLVGLFGIKERIYLQTISLIVNWCGLVLINLQE